MFVDRRRELKRLDEAWASDQAELWVVYGRRRVGKTALLRHMLADRPHVYWVATLSSDDMLRRDFADALARKPDGDGTPVGVHFDSWEAGFLAAGRMAQERRVALVIDEYPYLVDSAAGVSSVLQKVWDEHLMHGRLMLILCGSSMGMMERETLDYGAPLYGRRTGHLKLGPLPAGAVKAFAPRWNPGEHVTAFATLGGIPAYLRLLNDGESLINNLDRHVLDPDGLLHREPEFLLRQELQDPRNYFAVLQAVAGGRTRLNDIAQAVGMPGTSANRYLTTLRELGLVERSVPVTETRPAKSRRGIYRVSDPFLRFWFRFVGPRRTLLEAGRTAAVRREVEEGLPQFVGPTFEQLCRDWLAAAQDVGGEVGPLERIGSWWQRDHEIDVVGVGRESLVVGECKWSVRPIGVSVLADLERASEPLTAKEQPMRVRQLLFSRSGFTPALTRLAASRDDLRLVDLDEVLDGLA